MKTTETTPQILYQLQVRKHLFWEDVTGAWWDNMDRAQTGMRHYAEQIYPALSSSKRRKLKAVRIVKVTTHPQIESTLPLA